jgi:alpha-tubulin suppressor-like RCC1 family protein
VYCWGADDFYQLGYEDPKADSPVPVAVNVGISGPFAGFDALGGHSCVLNTADAIYCWGDIGPQVSGFASVSAGGLHQCGITTGGVARCWGINNYGQLGDGTHDPSWLDPVTVALPAGVTAASISAGGTFSCALTTTGSAYCWGQNNLGQLGNGSGTASDVPVPVSLPAGVSLVSLELGPVHACGLTATGAAWCWGENTYGQLGDGTTTASPTPVAVSLPAGVTGFASLSAGSMHTCGIATTGAGYCWGKNDFGQLGDGTTTSSSTPQLVGGGLTFQTP